MERLERFFTQSYLSFKAIFAWLDPKSYIFIKLIAPIFQLLFFCLLAKYCYGTSDLAPYVVGNALLLCTMNCIFGLGQIFEADRFYGTLKVIIIMPTSKFILLLQRGFPYALDAMSSVIIGGVVGSIVFDIHYTNINIWLLLLILFIAMFVTSSFGLLISLCSLMTSEIHILLNVINMMLIALCGVNFPIEELPFFLRQISICLPLTRSVAASKIILSGGSFQEITSLLVGEIIIGIVFIFVAYLLLTLVEKIARKNATLDLF